MTKPKVPVSRDSHTLARLLDSAAVRELIATLEATRWTGRPGYPIRTMVGMTLVKSLYALPTWTRTTALVREHAALRMALGCPDPADTPSHWACYSFTSKLRHYADTLDVRVAAMLSALHDKHPELGEQLAIDGPDLAREAKMLERHRRAFRDLVGNVLVRHRRVRRRTTPYLTTALAMRRDLDALRSELGAQAAELGLTDELQELIAEQAADDRSYQRSRDIGLDVRDTDVGGKLIRSGAVVFDREDDAWPYYAERGRRPKPRRDDE